MAEARNADRWRPLCFSGLLSTPRTGVEAEAKLAKATVILTYDSVDASRMEARIELYVRQSQTTTSKSLSSGAKAAIAACIVGGVAIICGLVAWTLWRRHRRQADLVARGKAQRGNRHHPRRTTEAIALDKLRDVERVAENGSQIAQKWICV